MLRFGDILVKENILSRNDIENAITESKAANKLLGVYLLEMNYITEEQNALVLSIQSSIDIVKLKEEPLRLDLRTLIKQELCQACNLVPYKSEGSNLYLAMADPYMFREISTVKRITGLNVITKIATKTDIAHYISKLYQSDIEENNLENLSKKEAEIKSRTAKEDNNNNEIESDAVVRLLASTIEDALAKNTSDIHIDPEKNSVSVKYRLDGILHPIRTISNVLLENLMRHIKIKAELDSTLSRVPQDGRFSIVSLAGNNIDVRVSLLPTLYGEKCTMRLLDKDKKVPILSSIGLLEEDKEAIQDLIKKPFGLILVCGPTGSGKSTTLSSILNEIKSPEKNIITLEDPIEYVIDGINQSNIDTKAGYTFGRGLRTILRQDPDVIMIGEIRDEETAKMAISAAITGHLVVSTLHTKDSIGAITRLHDMGIEDYYISSCLVGVISQRLARKVCTCSTKRLTDITENKILGIDTPAEIADLHSCSKCNEGFDGRLPVVEVLKVSPPLKEIITNSGTEVEMINYLKSTNFVPLRENAHKHVLKGSTTLVEVARILGI